MFKKLIDNHHIELRVKRDSAVAPVEEPATAVNPEELSRIAKGLVKYTAIAGVIVMSAGAVLHTLSEIAVIAAEAGINNKED